MKQNEFYEVDGCMDFIPVKLIKEHKHINLLEVEVMGSGSRTFSPSIYKFLKVHEPQRVVVPAFIDSFIVYAKAEGMSLFIAMDNAQNKESEWIIAHEDTFARAWLDGYEVEKEQLYVVNLGKIVGLSIYLRKIGKSLHSERGDWSTTGDIRFAELLTETEIKQKDEQLWQLAEPVEEN